MTLPPTVAFSEKCKRIFRSDALSLSLSRGLFSFSQNFSKQQHKWFAKFGVALCVLFKILFDLIQTKVNNEQSI